MSVNLEDVVLIAYKNMIQLVGRTSGVILCPDFELQAAANPENM